MSSLFANIKKSILGSGYALSFSFISKSAIRKYNLMYRGKDAPTDVLSFAYSKDEGEIVICKEVAKRKAKDFGMPAKKYIAYVFIHAILHLKGMRHGSKMSLEEQRWLKKFQ